MALLSEKVGRYVLKHGVSETKQATTRRRGSGLSRLTRIVALLAFCQYLLFVQCLNLAAVTQFNFSKGQQSFL